MPFDAAPVVRSPLADNIAGQSALVLDMVEFFFRAGAQWGQGIGSETGTRALLAWSHHLRAPATQRP